MRNMVVLFGLVLFQLAYGDVLPGFCRLQFLGQPSILIKIMVPCVKLVRPRGLDNLVILLMKIDFGLLMAAQLTGVPGVGNLVLQFYVGFHAGASSEEHRRPLHRRCDGKGGSVACKEAYSK